MEKSLTLHLEHGWKFINGDAKRWTYINHSVCYDATKTRHELGETDVFLTQNAWKDVVLPHDWNTLQPAGPQYAPSLGFKPRDTGWYYCEVELPQYAEDACISLEFDGIMGESVVYVNGVLAARNESGYTAFAFDISDYAQPGKNLIAVSVDNRRWEGWWYEGAGIYRPVRLKIEPAIHLGRKTVFVNPKLTQNGWVIDVSARIDNTTAEEASYLLHVDILDAEGASTVCAQSEGSASPYAQTVCQAQAVLKEARLWSPETPYLYTAVVSLDIGGERTAQERIRFGLRDIAWTDHGMYINGQKTRVNGICCHQDHAGVGIAVTKSVIRYRIAKLKAMGCNAYRWAHHCPSEYLLEVCDELGMLVMAENRHFRSSEEVLRQLDELVLCARNHPSVFLYSLFNEEHWQGERRGRRIAEKMTRRVKQLDESRPVTAAMNGGVLMQENASDVLDVAGINYCLGDYMKYAERRPGHPMVATENGPLYATRGVYQDDKEKQVYNSYGLTTSDFGQTLQDTIRAVDAAPHLAGLFVWGGFDYRGEPQPFEWPSVYSHWGLTDNCGFEKDTFYMLKSYYDAPTEPMLHLLPHWNWADGENVRVCAMTNCSEVTFILNGKTIATLPVKDRRAECRIPFERGVLRAEAVYEGAMIADEVKTAGPAAQLEVIDAATEKDYDSSILCVRLLDAAGVPVPGQAQDRAVTFKVKKGRILGVGNGNPNGVYPEISESIPTFSGRCQAIVAPDANGAVDVLVCAEGVEPVEIRRNVKP